MKLKKFTRLGTKTGTSIALALGLTTSLLTAEVSNQEKVTHLLKSIETGEREPAKYINPKKYIQHNLGVADGIAGFAEVLKALPKGSAKVNTVRAFTDGQYVFTHSEYDFFGPKVGFDIFRFEDGLIVEHWDNLTEKVEETKSGRTQTDGPTEVEDKGKTAENKATVKAMITDVFINGKNEKITEFISTEQYDQHNPAVGDGLAALGEALAGMAKAGTPMVYEKNHIILGEGNFVLAVSEGKFLGKHTCFYDLFRLKDGKVVEHWDAIEAIPEKSTWKNDNGKFGF